MIMMNLFSVFDPISYFGFPLNWIGAILVLFMFFCPYYVIKGSSQSGGGVLLIINKMLSEVAGSQSKGIVFVVVSVFIYLVIMNLLGLFPFIFTPTSHPFFTMGFGLVFWMSFFLMGWLKNFKVSAAHLVPEGSPLMLAPLMVVIESISHLMRPFTLSIRLAANMMAGHLIISLLASISTLSFMGFYMSIFFQSMLLVLEVGVSVIQGFVFSILLLLYSLEYY